MVIGKKYKFIIFFSIFVIIIGVSGYSLWKIEAQQQEDNRKIEAQQQEDNRKIEELENKNKELEDEIQKLRINPCPDWYNIDLVTDMSELNLKTCRKIDLEHNEIKKIENLETAEEVEYIYLNDNDITTIENIETIPSEEFTDHGELWVDESIDYITEESYNFIVNNQIKFFFVQKNGETGSGYVGSDKRLDDLEII